MWPSAPTARLLCRARPMIQCGESLHANCYVFSRMTHFCLRNLPTRPSVWDLASGECKSTLRGHTDPVLSVAISPDSKTVVSGSGNLWGHSMDHTVR